MNQTEIAVGIIKNEQRQIFITQRGEDSHLAGYWEFPGGKLKSSETPKEALERELLEEVDIHVMNAKYLTATKHEYADKTLIMHLFLVTKWDGEPLAIEGQNSRWIEIENINADDFPAANLTIIEALKASF